MLSSRTIRRAMQIGRQQADHVLAQRKQDLRRRRTALARIARTRKRRPLPRPAPQPKLMRMLGGPAPNGVLVAEGDSWFDYPWKDILDCLEDSHGYEVESVAHWGHRAEAMAYGGSQLLDFTRKIEKVVRRGDVPRAVLFSGGGNDVAGDTFQTLLDHAGSATPGLNDAVVTGLLERVALAYVTILAAVTRVCRDLLGRTVPILVHGYDYAVPDGRGVLGGFWLLPGPWLEPGFRAKGYQDLPQRIAIVVDLIDRFHVMLGDVTQRPEFQHVEQVDLRGTLSNSPGNYKTWWANELHPKPTGFEAVTTKLASALAQIP